MMFQRIGIYSKATAVGCGEVVRIWGREGGLLRKTDS